MPDAGVAHGELHEALRRHHQHQARVAFEGAASALALHVDPGHFERDAPAAGRELERVVRQVLPPRGHLQAASPILDQQPSSLNARAKGRNDDQVAPANAAVLVAVKCTYNSCTRALSVPGQRAISLSRRR
jgi:hypothetical protein